MQPEGGRGICVRFPAVLLKEDPVELNLKQNIFRLSRQGR